jgi:hypothetical protein
MFPWPKTPPTRPSPDPSSAKTPKQTVESFLRAASATHGAALPDRHPRRRSRAAAPEKAMKSLFGGLKGLLESAAAPD